MDHFGDGKGPCELLVEECLDGELDPLTGLVHGNCVAAEDEGGPTVPLAISCSITEPGYGLVWDIHFRITAMKLEADTCTRLQTESNV